MFHVKWQGYENPKDQTWEPEANMYVACETDLYMVES